MLRDSLAVGFLFFLGFLALAGGGLTILRYWLVEGTLDGAAATLLAGCMFFFTAIAIKTSSPALIAIWIIIVIAATIAVPWLAARNEKSTLIKMHEQDIAKYRRAIENNPRNYLAWREMGEIYMHINRYNEAIAAFKEAIKLDPPDVEKIRRRLNAALEYRAGIMTTETVVCDVCHKKAPKSKVCMHCGSPLELTFLDWLLQRDTLLGMLRPALAITAGAVATTTIFLTLPVEVKAAIIAISVVVAAFIIWRMVQDV